MQEDNGHYIMVSQTISFPGCTKNDLWHMHGYYSRVNIIKKEQSFSI